MMKDSKVKREDLKFVLYARKSTEESGKQIHSIEDQIAECQEYAARQGDINIIETIREERSAKYAENRKKFTKMLQDIKAGTYDAIITWHPDRLARNMLEAGEVLDMLTPAKNKTEPYLKDLVFPTVSYSNDSGGRLTLAVLFSIATQYSEHLAESVSRGHSRNLTSRGVSAGIYKWGYKRAQNGQYVPDDNYSLIKKGWDMILNGKSQTEVLNYWIKMGVTRKHKVKPDGSQKPPMKPTKDTVSRVFHDTFYHGLLQQAGDSVDLRDKSIQKDFRPMITEEEYQKVQNILDGRYQTHRHRTTSTIELPLKGLVYCDVCGSKMYPGASGNRKGTKRKIVYYSCQNKKCTRRKKNVRGRIIFDDIVETLNKMKLEGGSYVAYAAAVDKYLDEEIGELKNQRSSLVAIRNTRKRELDAENLTYGRLVDPGNKTPKTTLNSARERIKNLECVIKDLNNDIQELSEKIKDPSSIQLKKDEFLNLINNSGKIVEFGSFAEKDAIVRKLFLNIRIDNKNKVSYLCRPELEGLITSDNFLFGGPDRT